MPGITHFPLFFAAVFRLNIMPGLDHRVYHWT